MAEYALIVASETKGGTWTGAIEQLNKFKFCPVMVNFSVLPASGNKKLVKLGAKPIHIDFSKPIVSQLTDAELVSTKNEQAELSFDNEFATVTAPASELQLNEASAEAEYTVSTPEKRIEQAVFPILQGILKESKNSGELQQMTGLKKGQIDDWLKKMCEQGLVKKLNKPVRYIARQSN